jgi:hypothetical protein
MVYIEKWSSFIVLLISTRPYDGAWWRPCATTSIVAAPCVATGIVEPVSKNPVCHAPVVLRVKAELMHARATVVLGKPHLDIASHLGPCLHLLGHLAIVPASRDFHVFAEPYGDVVSLVWQDGVQRLRHTGTQTYTDTQTHRYTYTQTHTNAQAHTYIEEEETERRVLGSRFKVALTNATNRGGSVLAPSSCVVHNMEL